MAPAATTLCLEAANNLAVVMKAANAGYAEEMRERLAKLPPHVRPVLSMVFADSTFSADYGRHHAGWSRSAVLRHGWWQTGAVTYIVCGSWGSNAREMECAMASHLRKLQPSLEHAWYVPMEQAVPDKRYDQLCFAQRRLLKDAKPLPTLKGLAAGSAKEEIWDDLYDKTDQYHFRMDRWQRTREALLKDVPGGAFVLTIGWNCHDQDAVSEFKCQRRLADLALSF